jgi:glutamate racemase
MHKNPIGVFDSGVGGLSVLRAIRELLPHEDVIYVADQAFAPYGKRTKSEIIQRADAISKWLLSQNCKLIVVACNTATTNAISHLRQTYDVPFVGIEPAIKPAALGSKTGVVGVLATEGTLSSELFQSTTQDHAKEIEVITQVGHGLVELVEEGNAESTHAETQLRRDLAPMLNHPIDHLVLGCTHYPFLRKTLKKILPKNVTIVDCGEAVAKQTKRLLEKHELQNEGDGKTAYFTTATPNKNLWVLFGVDAVEHMAI